MSRTTMAAFGLIGALALGASPEPAVAQSGDRAGSPDRVEMTVTGMACPLCEAALERKLEELDGIARVESDSSSGKVSFDLAEPHELTEERLRELVRDAGFAVAEISRAPWIDRPGGEGH